ncbi:MAG: hypothetical protein U9R08_05515 [Nanoarchaeota archaeon]|nr:hypothetical protein [Nanoarchaeota archaeon]
MKKRGQTTFISSKLISLLLGIAVFVIGISALNSSILRLGSRAPASYDELVRTITTIEDGELISLPLYVDEETAILAFDPGSNYLGFQSGYSFLGYEDDGGSLITSDKLSAWTFSSIADWLLLKVPGANIILIVDKLTIDFISKAFKINFIPEFMKPDSCTGTDTCICLCRDFEVESLEAGYEFDKYYPKYSCSSTYHCKTLPRLKVILSKKQHHEEFRTNFGGYIFERGLVLKNDEEKLREVYVERKADFVYVCDYYPCISESIKVRVK